MTPDQERLLVAIARALSVTVTRDDCVRELEAALQPFVDARDYSRLKLTDAMRVSSAREHIATAATLLRGVEG